MIFIDGPTAKYVMNEREKAFRAAWCAAMELKKYGWPGSDDLEQAWHRHKADAVRRESGD